MLGSSRGLWWRLLPFYAALFEAVQSEFARVSSPLARGRLPDYPVNWAQSTGLTPTTESSFVDSRAQLTRIFVGK
jgi:hypothetical protein